MANIKINQERCKGCFLCVGVCQKKFLKKSKNFNKKGFRFVEFKEGAECVGCAMCTLVCPDCCIEIWKE